MLQPDGIVNILLNKVGIGDQLWLAGPTSYWTLILVEIWAAWPFIYLLALSGLQSVDGEVHEASALDGASWWPKLRYIVLPYLKGPIALAFLLATLNHINNFTLPYVLFGAPAPEAVNVMPMIVYVTSFQSLRFGLSAAMAIVSLIIIAIPLFIYLRAVRLDVHEEEESDEHRHRHPHPARRPAKGRAGSEEAHRLMPTPAVGRPHHAPVPDGPHPGRLHRAGLAQHRRRGRGR